MNEFSCVLLHVDARQTNALLPLFRIDIHPAMFGDRQVVLRGLEVLWQIRIVVILAVELAVSVDRAVRRQPRLDGEMDDLTVDDRENAGQTEADGTDMCVLRGSEPRSTAAEDLGLCLELAVNLKADDGFVFHALPPIGAIFVWKSCPCS